MIKNSLQSDVRGLRWIETSAVERDTRPEVVGVLSGRAGRRSFITSSSVRARLLGRRLAPCDVLLLFLAFRESSVKLDLGVVEAVPAVLRLVPALLAVGAHWNLLLDRHAVAPAFRSRCVSAQLRLECLDLGLEGVELL